MALFDLDIFSQSIPKWNKAPVSLVNKLCPVLEQLTPSIKINNIDIEYSGASEINSANYRVSNFENKFVVKKWPKGKDVKNIQSIEKVTYFLKESDIPVADIIPFRDGEKIMKSKSNFWTCSNFIPGEFYSGKKDQLRQVSILTAKTVTSLNNLSIRSYSTNQIMYEIEDIYMVFKRFSMIRSQWDLFLGDKTYNLLDTNWDNLFKKCNLFKRSKINGGPVSLSHYDMHPHNLLFQENNPSCLLDLESIVKIPIGFSVAYSALKQCRQYVAFNRDSCPPSHVGKTYLDTLKSHLRIKKSEVWIKNFSEMAQIETMRRIAIIFELNFKGDKKWNKMLPLLINNFHEAQELFN
tara:strand:+ start:4360 stop:5412 length:1053 start_codon:yes stop_codon:yes gene_type:complete